MSAIASTHHGTLPASSGLKKFGEVATWLAFAVSGIVYFEPAPYDGMMIGLLWLLPILGLSSLTSSLVLFLSLLLVISAGGLIASTQAIGLTDTTTHTFITLYLSFTAVLIAGFIYVKPASHVRLIMSGYMTAAIFACFAAILGYFNLVPGAGELFTQYGRASGTFKDPNVFGAFLVPPCIYAFHLFLEKRALPALFSAALVAFFAFAILISLSRGAWLNLTLSLLSFAYLSFVTARTNRKRFKLIALAAVSVIAVAAVIGAALQSRSISGPLHERAALTNSYDVGPEGRFGGQSKAVDVILDNPLGIGPLEFGKQYHHEEVHNIYLGMFLKAGWQGGFAYLILTILTLVLGLQHLLHDTKTRALFLVLFACFIGVATEGMIIDTDHWRHYFALLGMIWGIMAAERVALTRVLPDKVETGFPIRSTSNHPKSRRSVVKRSAQLIASAAT